MHDSECRVNEYFDQWAVQLVAGNGKGLINSAQNWHVVESYTSWAWLPLHQNSKHILGQKATLISGDALLFFFFFLMSWVSEYYYFKPQKLDVNKYIQRHSFEVFRNVVVTSLAGKYEKKNTTLISHSSN